MLEDFRQEKQEQPLDTLSEGSALPLTKKVVLLTLAVALIGLFIFFTSDSWSSDEKTSKDSISKQIEEIQGRLSDLEQKIQNSGQPSYAMPSQPLAPQNQESLTQNDTASTLNLQSIIEQEFRDVAMTSQETPAAATEAPRPTTKKQATPSQSKSQSYTVQKGDSLSKISYKCYGTTKRWKKILDANKDKLNGGQVLKPGMTLTIPKDDSEK
jgi:LysM repeat protein